MCQGLLLFLKNIRGVTVTFLGGGAMILLVRPGTTMLHDSGR